MDLESILQAPLPLHVDGREHPSSGATRFISRDPSTGDALVEISSATSADVDAAVQAARRSAWHAAAPSERGRMLQALAARIRTEAGMLARAESLDAGVPIAMAALDAEVAARYFEFYAGLADKITGQTIPLGSGLTDFTVREPWGVCGIIVPFNFPLQLTARSVAVALATGNAVVVKSAEQAPVIPHLLARLATQVGLPAGAFNVLHGHGEVGAAIIEHPDVDHVTFTGSLATGVKVMQACAHHVKPITLELGGKSAQIVFADAPMPDVMPAIVGSVFRTAGQVCSAGTRVLVQADVADQVVSSVKAAAQTLRIGRAVDDPEVGPVISHQQLELILEYIQAGSRQGATLHHGGSRVEADGLDTGYFMTPTIFTDVTRDMALAQEEIFGPVLSVMTFNDPDEALDLAESTPYGLVAGVWTRDIGRAFRFASDLKVGQVFVNNYGVGAGVELPFGGYKRSGFGREKGLEAVGEYTQVKNVCVKYN